MLVRDIGGVDHLKRPWQEIMHFHSPLRVYMLLSLEKWQALKRLAEFSLLYSHHLISSILIHQWCCSSCDTIVCKAFGLSHTKPKVILYVIFCKMQGNYLIEVLRCFSTYKVAKLALERGSEYLLYTSSNVVLNWGFLWLMVQTGWSFVLYPHVLNHVSHSSSLLISFLQIADIMTHKLMSLLWPLCTCSDNHSYLHLGYINLTNKQLF